MLLCAKCALQIVNLQADMLLLTRLDSGVGAKGYTVVPKSSATGLNGRATQ
jgi:hypothetical protein